MASAAMGGEGLPLYVTDIRSPEAVLRQAAVSGVSTGIEFAFRLFDRLRALLMLV